MENSGGTDGISSASALFAKINLSLETNIHRNYEIAQPLGLQYNHYVSMSVRGQLVKNLIALEPHDIYTYACHWHAKRPFLDGRGFANCMSSLFGQ